MEALEKRHSSREFAPDALPLSLLSNLLWAAYGVNRVDGGRTAPSALNAQEIEFMWRCLRGRIFMTINPIR
jgi:nitroreductase